MRYAGALRAPPRRTGAVLFCNRRPPGSTTTPNIAHPRATATYICIFGVIVRAMSHAKDFATALAELGGHRRLKHALEECMAGGWATPWMTAAAAPAADEAVAPHTVAHSMMEGAAALEPRLELYVGIAKALHATVRDGLFCHLGNCELGLPGIREFSRLITPPLRSPALTNNLVYLDLSDNYLTGLGSDYEPLRNVCFQLARFQNLRFLSLHNNTLLLDGSAIVTRMLRFTRTLEYLDLGRCNIGERGANALFAAFCSEDDYDPALLRNPDEAEAEGTSEADAEFAAAEQVIPAAVSSDSAVVTASLSAAPAAAVASAALPIPANMSNTTATAPGAIGGAAGDNTTGTSASTTSGAAAGVDGLPPRPDMVKRPSFSASSTAASSGVVTSNLGFGFGSGMPDRPSSASSTSSRPRSGLRSKVAAAAAVSGANTSAVAPAAGAGPSAPAAPGAVVPASVGAALMSPSGVLKERPCTSLLWLDLSNNNLCGYGYDPLPGARLIRTLVELPKLTYLNLSNNRMTRAAASALAIALEFNKSLVTLMLDSNGIDGTNAIKIAEACNIHPTLSHLSLRFNSARSDGAIAFASVFKNRPDGPLAYVDLRDNYVGDVGTAALLQAFGLRASAPSAPAASEPEKRVTLAPAAVAVHAAPASGQTASTAAPAQPAPPVQDKPAGSGVVLAGSGAAALLALRRQQAIAAAALVSPLASADSKWEGAVEKKEACEAENEEAIAEPAAQRTSVTEDGTIVQLVSAAAVTPSPHALAAHAAHPGVRIVRLDGDACARVLVA